MEEAMLDIRMTAKLACCMALALGSAAMAAQQRSTIASEERGDLDEIRKVSTLIGTDVMNRANTKIADLRDLVLSPGGDVLYAVLGHGGVGGIGETQTAAPFDALEVRHANGKWAVNLDMNAEDLKQAPTIQSENYREFTDVQWMSRVHQFFRTRGEPKTRPEAGTTPAQREPRALEWVILATKICASKVKNLQNEDLGKVEDLLLDRMHRVAFLIVGRGGVLGVGEHYIPVPWSRLSLSTNTETAAVTAAIDATKAQLDKAPLVKGDNYATLLAHGFADEVRRYFGAIGRGANAGAPDERR
jgi:hypothetical protein